MRNVLLAFGLSLQLLEGYAQNPIPNPSFENWTAGEPDSWSTSNAATPSPSIVQVADPHSGAYALKGEVVIEGDSAHIAGVSLTGLPVSQAYSVLRFYYKLDMPVLSWFSTSVVMSDGVSAVGTGELYLEGETSMATYTLATIPITYTGTPTECELYFAAWSWVDEPGAFFVIDDVELTDTPSGQPDAETLLVHRIQPNPAQHSASIYYHQPNRGDLRIEVVDLTGKTLLTKALSDESPGGHRYDLEFDLPNGTYIVRIGDGIQTGQSKLVVLNP
jgi:hypothetical protein